MFFSGYFCQQYITDLEEIGNESQYRECPPLGFGVAYLLYIV
jgi:hypothetical protein